MFVESNTIWHRRKCGLEYKIGCNSGTALSYTAVLYNFVAGYRSTLKLYNALNGAKSCTILALYEILEFCKEIKLVNSRESLTKWFGNENRNGPICYIIAIDEQE